MADFFTEQANHYYVIVVCTVVELIHYHELGVMMSYRYDMLNMTVSKLFDVHLTR